MRGFCLSIFAFFFIFGCGGVPSQQELKSNDSTRNYNMAPMQVASAGMVAKQRPENSPISRDEESSTEDYKDYGVNPRVETQKDKFSTFAIDVDTASYTIARRKLNEGTIPPKEAIRIEEFINYFPSEYPKNRSEWFQVHLEASLLLSEKQHYYELLFKEKILHPKNVKRRI